MERDAARDLALRRAPGERPLEERHRLLQLLRRRVPRFERAVAKLCRARACQPLSVSAAKWSRATANALRARGEVGGGAGAAVEDGRVVEEAGALLGGAEGEASAAAPRGRRRAPAPCRRRRARAALPARGTSRGRRRPGRRRARSGSASAGRRSRRSPTATIRLARRSLSRRLGAPGARSRPCRARGCFRGRSAGSPGRPGPRRRGAAPRASGGQGEDERRRVRLARPQLARRGASRGRRAPPPRPPSPPRRAGSGGRPRPRARRRAGWGRAGRRPGTAAIVPGSNHERTVTTRVVGVRGRGRRHVVGDVAVHLAEVLAFSGRERPVAREERRAEEQDGVARRRPRARRRRAASRGRTGAPPR